MILARQHAPWRSTLAHKLSPLGASARWVRERIRLSGLARDVPLSVLRHDTRPVHRAEGYGGQPIEAFPPFGFFRMYLEGRIDAARDAFRAWYRAQFDKYMHLEKSVGGMQYGSLYQTVVDLHRSLGLPLARERPEFASELVERAITIRVNERFQLLSAIERHGYDRKGTDPVVGVARGDHIYLTGGHHRAAALRAIEKDVLPAVLVLSPVAHYAFRQLKIA